MKTPQKPETTTGTETNPKVNGEQSNNMETQNLGFNGNRQYLP